MKAQESELQEKIHRALEQENLERESSKEKSVKSSQVLQQELDEIARKVEQHREKRNIEKNYPEIYKSRQQLLQCYKQYKDRPLDCWQEAADFRLAVRRAEQVSLPASSFTMQSRMLTETYLPFVFSSFLQMFIDSEATVA